MDCPKCISEHWGTLMVPNLSLEEYVSGRIQFQDRFFLKEGNPWFRCIDSLSAQAKMRGEQLVSFANYDYLGLSGHPSIAEAVSNATAKFGVGALGSRLVGGERKIHAEFESAVAGFVGTEGSLATVSGYLTNVSLISHLVSSKDVIIVDCLSHNSIIAGAEGSGARVIQFRHNDIDHLRHILRTQRQESRNCLIAVESLYSMDGDLLPLPEVLALKEQYAAWLLVDEAHSIGVLGHKGRGISEHYGEDPKRIDLIVGTLSKTFVSCGGFVCGARKVIEWLKYRLPGFVYSVGISPIIAAAAYAALTLVVREPERIARLQYVSEYFLTRARDAGLNTGSAVGRGIVPVMFADFRSAMSAAKLLLDNDIYAPPIVHIGVPKSGHRIRFFLSAAHQPEQLEAAVSILTSLTDLLEPRSVATA
jgi:8-amino-7-oxononanoate synthase